MIASLPEVELSSLTASKVLTFKSQPLRKGRLSPHPITITHVTEAVTSSVYQQDLTP